MNCRKISVAVLSAVAGLAGAHQANAATVNLCGPNVCYDYDDTQAAISITGLPTLVGDSVTFLPPDFRAESANGAGWDIVTANFLFSRVYTVNPLDEITLFSVWEELDHQIITDGEVEATLYTQARSNHGAFPTDVIGISTTSSFLDTGDTGGVIVSGLSALLYPAASFTGPADDMQVGIQNTLRAYTDASGQVAFIQKKFTLATNTAEAVPVPTAIWLFGSALGALRMLRRRT